jgi:hypothetical protein
MIDGAAGEVANLDLALHRTLHRRRVGNPKLVGADDTHLGQVEAARLAAEKFPAANLQITHR